MTGPHEVSLEALPPDVGCRIDEACDRFESAWQAGARPRIDDFVTEPEGPARAALLRELIRLDVAKRRGQREGPTVADYASLFPAGEPGWLAREVIDRAGRYQLAGEIGRGGMGAVYEARDPDLGRVLAVKVLREDHRADAAARDRFLREAHVTARLQHPSIPSVHEQGELADGRPYFAMKLIRGRDLHELLSERSLAAPEVASWLPVFAQVCQGVAYAHSQGVLHRDLKPRNVMVGEFGEVQVMDWGLAKILTEDAEHERRGSAPPHSRPDLAGDPERTTDHSPAAQSTGEGTRSGQAFGTPAYMPPEQARGELDRIDRRSDVFALGGILCVVLTGSPPFTGSRGADVFAKASAGDLTDAFARLDGCGADAELVALCKRCLAADPADRPADAKEVADLVASHRIGMAERLRLAELGRIAAATRLTEQRKRRRVQYGLLAAVALLVSLVAATGWWQQRERDRREATLAREADNALQLAGTLCDSGWKQSMDPRGWSETLGRATHELERAKSLLDSRGGASELRERAAQVRRRIEEATTDCQFTQGVEDALGLVFEVAGTPDAHGIAAKRLEQLLRDRGFDPTGPGRERLVEWARSHRLESSVQSLLMFVSAWHPEWKSKLLYAEVLSASTGGKPSKPFEWFKSLAESAVTSAFLGPRNEDKDTLTRLSADPDIENLSPTALALAGRAMLRRGDREVALRRLYAWQARHPYNFWLNVQLATALQSEKPPHRQEAIRYAKTAVAIRGDSPRAHFTLSAAYYENENFAAADAACRKALEIDSRYANAQNLDLQIQAKLAAAGRRDNP